MLSPWPGSVCTITVVYILYIILLLIAEQLSSTITHNYLYSHYQIPAKRYQ